MKRIFLIFLIIGALSCSGKSKPKGSFVYLEVEGLDPKIEKCFQENLYGTWADINSQLPHTPQENSSEKNPENIHIYKPYKYFDLDKDKPGTNKLMVRVYGDGDTASTFFQVQRYQLEEAGNWQRTLNLGNFRVNERENDHISPGKIDDDEICNMLLRICIQASFK